MKLENICIVMVGTTHPGNIGAAARVMTNMCLGDLRLVDPQCPIGEIAYARASGAHAVLDNRKTCNNLADAIADCEYVFATSARRRSLAWPSLNPTDMVEQLMQFNQTTRVALVFGREHSGLTNEEIQQSNAMICIPTNPEFSSLNIAAAIQVVCYEIYKQYDASTTDSDKTDEFEDLASSAETEGMFEHLQQVLLEIDFIDPQQPGQIMQRLRRMYLRNKLSRNEVNILRGILSNVQKRIV
ncbi:MAG: RNA methyltransferase [Pseudomonadota bacterium]